MILGLSVVDGTSKSSYIERNDCGCEGPGLPKAFALYQNYPNPFNPTTTLRYDVPKAARVRITVYNLLGRRVATLLNKQMPAGRHKVGFDGTALTSDLYMYRIATDDFLQVKKLMFVKKIG